ncbi:MAG: branched-chain amino acid ABC transporter permease [Rhodospirillales bacterium]
MIVFIGLLVIFNSLAGWIFTYTIKTISQPVPQANRCSASIGCRRTNSARLALPWWCWHCCTAFFRFTPLGLAMRAAAQNPVSSRLVGPVSSRLVGIRVGWMLALGWGLAAAVGSIAGMMIAPVVFLDPNMMSGILLYAFAAALVGGIDSPGGAVFGGFLVGVLENLVGAAIGTELKLTVALVLIIGVLVVRPSGLFGKVHVTRV